MTHETFTYDEHNIVLDRYRLSDEEAIKLSVERCICIEGQTWFRKKRYDSRLQAEPNLRSGEIIAEARTAVFILTRNQNECERAPQAHMGIKPITEKANVKGYMF